MKSDKVCLQLFLWANEFHDIIYNTDTQQTPLHTALLSIHLSHCTIIKTQGAQQAGPAFPHFCECNTESPTTYWSTSYRLCNQAERPRTAVDWSGSRGRQSCCTTPERDGRLGLLTVYTGKEEIRCVLNRFHIQKSLSGVQMVRAPAGVTYMHPLSGFETRHGLMAVKVITMAVKVITMTVKVINEYKLVSWV